MRDWQKVIFNTVVAFGRWNRPKGVASVLNVIKDLHVALTNTVSHNIVLHPHWLTTDK